MRKMKNSGIEWIGEIPESWDTCKLKYVVDLRTEKTINKLSCLQYIGLEHVESYSGSLVKGYTSITDFNGDTLNYYCGDVLFGKLRPYLAKALIADCDGKCSSEFWVMKPKKVSGKYLLYSVLSNNFIANIDHSTYGVKMPRAEWDYAGNQKICIPDMEMQNKIVNYLDKKCAEIDALIEAKEKANALLKELRQSIIYEAVTKGLDPDAPMKDSGIEWIGEIPEGWAITKLKSVAKIITGNTPSKTTGTEENFAEQGMLWVKPDNLDGLNFIRNTKEKLTQKGVALAKVVEPFTPLVCCIGTIGKIGVSNQKVSFNQQINAICFSKCIERRFGLYSLLAQEEQHGFYANGNVLKILNSEDHGQIVITFPNHDEQCEISAYLDKKCAEIDKLIKANNTTIEKLKEYRKSVIFEAVTGKIEV